jgi:hypothetical protein
MDNASDRVVVTAKEITDIPEKLCIYYTTITD